LAVYYTVRNRDSTEKPLPLASITNGAKFPHLAGMRFFYRHELESYVYVKTTNQKPLWRGEQW